MSTAADDSDLENEIEVLVENYLEMARNGVAPSIAEFANCHAEWQPDLQEILETVHAVEQLRPALSDSPPLPGPKAPSPEVVPEIDGYRILRTAGHGGMGVVYEAIQVSLDRRVALKILPSRLFQNHRARERFQVEAKAAAGLHHNHIVPVFEVRTQGTHAFYTMQFIEGESLDEVIVQLRNLRAGAEGKSSRGDQREPPAAVDLEPLNAAVTLRSETLARTLFAKPFPSNGDDAEVARSSDRNRTTTVSRFGETTKIDRPPSSSGLVEPSNNRLFFLNVARIGVQVAQAIHHAHRHGVIHRDIKPSNIMVDLDGNAWVTDFGLAKVDEHDLTGEGDIVGTLRYIAPERFAGVCDERSDVYSLGLTLYELIGQQPAFVQSDRMELVKKIQEGKSDSLKTLNSKVPRDLQTIIEKSIHSVPSRRYRSADVFAEDLQRFCEGLPINARRVGSIEKSWLWSKKNSGLAAAIVIVSMLLVVGTIASTMAAFHFHRQEEIQSNLVTATQKLVAEKQLLVDAKQQEADKARKLRNEALHDAYLADIRQASVDARTGRIHRLLTSFKRYLPSESQPDIRGWEWHHLMSLANQADATLFEFEGAVTQVKWSADGTEFYSCGTDGKLRTWDRDGNPIRHISIPGLKQFSVNADNTQFATVSDDPVLRFWDVESGELKQTIRVGDRPLTSVAWKYGSLVAVASPPGSNRSASEVVLLERHTEAILFRHAGNETEVDWLEISPQGTGLAIAGRGMGVAIPFFGQKTPVVINGPFVKHWNDTTSIAWHPDGRRFAVGFDTRGVVVYEIDRNAYHPTQLFQLDEDSTPDALEFTPDGKSLIVGTRSQRIDIYDLESKRRTRSFPGHLRSISDLAVHPTDPLVVSASGDGTIRFWNLDNEPERNLVADDPIEYHKQGESPDKQWTWGIEKDVLSVYEAGSDQPAWEMFVRANAAKAMFLPDINQAVFWAEGGSYGPRYTSVVDFKNDSVWSMNGFGGARPYADIKGDFLVVAQHADIHLFNLLDGTMNQFSAATTQDGAVLTDVGVALSPRGKALVTCSDGEVKIWDTEECRVLASLYGHQPGTPMSIIVWSHDSPLFATGSRDQTICIWDSVERRLVQTLHGLQGPPSMDLFGFDAGNTRFASADGTHLKIWEIASGRELLSLPLDEDASRVFHAFQTQPAADAKSVSSEKLQFAVLDKCDSISAAVNEREDFEFRSTYRLAINLLAKSRLPTYDPVRGLTLAERASELRPLLWQTWFLRGVANYRLGRWEEARRVLKMAIDSDGEHGQVEFLLDELCAGELRKSQDPIDAVEIASRMWSKASSAGDELRPLVQHLAREIIAEEAEPAKHSEQVVTTLRDELDFANDDLSMREAFYLTPENGVITFGVEGTIELTLGTIKIDRSVELLGPGKDRLHISGAGRTTLFELNNFDPDELAEVRMSDLHLTKGYSGDAVIGEEKSNIGRGVIHVHESLQLENCLLDDHRIPRGFGGAVYVCEDAKLDVIGCSFYSNLATAGGAIFSSTHSSIKVQDSTFIGNKEVLNRAEAGSAIRGGGDVHLINCTFARNHAGNGGAVSLTTRESTVLIENCTFSENVGGGIFSHRYPLPPQAWDLSATNCIFYGNVSEEGEPLDIWSNDQVQVKVSNSIIGADRGGVIDAGGNVRDADPLLQALGDNGGSTLTYGLGKGSPAIDAGSEIPQKYDQRGSAYARRVDGDLDGVETTDIGAFEYQAIEESSGRAEAP